MRPRKTAFFIATAILLVLFWAVSSIQAGSPANAPPGQEEVTAAGLISPLLQYQGRLTKPNSNEAVADGNYTLTFRLYNAASGGTPLWTETEDVVVQGGLFSTVLGDAVPLNQALFNGRALWLGIKVGSDAEATPRQQLLPVAYALSLAPGAAMEANSGPVLKVNHTGGGEALQVGGNLNVSGSLIGGSHNHNASNITSGALADARIASSIARDSEIMPRVLASDGPGSGLNADLLDGSHANAFASASHVHDNRYYTESESESRYVNVTGDTMSGALTVPRVSYTTPRTHYFVVGSEAFVPGSNVDYTNTYGCGGAYVAAAGSHTMVAPVHLPQGAVVTKFEVFFNDSSDKDMSVSLWRQFLRGCGFSSMATVSSSGNSGYYSQSDTTISNSVIDNTVTSYLVYAYSTDWGGGNLKIKGALITYTLAEAP